MSTEPKAQEVVDHANRHLRRSTWLRQHVLPLAIVQLLLAATVVVMMLNEQTRLMFAAAFLQLSLLVLMLTLSKLSELERLTSEHLAVGAATLQKRETQREEEKS